MSSPSPSSSGIDSLITARENREMFDDIAANYDAANRAMSFGLDRRWRREAVHALSPAEGGRYLDIGTGTGAVTFEILRQAPGARVTGVDPSERMLAIAQQKATAMGLARGVSFEVGDAVRLAAADASMEGVISAFCFRNIVHRQAALHEMHRVLQDNGRLVLLELTYPSRRFIRLLYHAYGRAIPVLGAVAGNAKAYRYLVKSIEEFLRPDEVVDMLGTAGFSDVRHHPYCGGTVSMFAARKAAT